MKKIVCVLLALLFASLMTVSVFADVAYDPIEDFTENTLPVVLIALVAAVVIIAVVVLIFVIVKKHRK